MTPLERAARALWDLAPEAFPPETPATRIPFHWAGEERREAYRDAVRTILRAIRDPSDEMVRAALGDAPPAGANLAKGRVDADLMVAEWQAMIDAALQSNRTEGGDK